MKGVKVFGEAWQRRRGALRGQGLVGGREVAGQRGRGNVTGGLTTAHLGKALRVQFGAQAVERVGPDVSGWRTGGAGAGGRALRRVVCEAEEAD